MPCHGRGVKNKTSPQILQANTQLSKNSLCSRSQGQAGLEGWHGARLALPARPQQHLSLSSLSPTPSSCYTTSLPLTAPLKARLGSFLLLLLDAARAMPYRCQPAHSGEHIDRTPNLCIIYEGFMHVVNLGDNLRKEMRGIGRVRWGRGAASTSLCDGVTASDHMDWTRVRQWDAQDFPSDRWTLTFLALFLIYCIFYGPGITPHFLFGFGLG